MGEWAKPGFVQTFHDPNGLYKAVDGLKPDTRKLIMAMAVKGSFRRGTWNGCVFNKIAETRSIQATAEKLDETFHAVSRFINSWDRTARTIPSDSVATEILIKCITQIGLSATQGKPEGHNAKRWTIRLHTSEETKMVEELRAEIDLGVFDKLLEEFESTPELCLV